MSLLQKHKIIQCFILFGCLLSLDNYSTILTERYTDEFAMIEDFETPGGSDSSENENSKYEDCEEKNKISESHYYTNLQLGDYIDQNFPSLSSRTVSIHIENITPPPES